MPSRRCFGFERSHPETAAALRVSTTSTSEERAAPMRL
jgi:hypothetical protein